VRGPVEGAEKGARGDRRIARAQRAAGDAGGDDRADAALVAVPFGDDERAETGREGVDLEMGGGTFDAADETEHVRARKRVEAVGQRPARAARVGERLEQTVERAVLAEEEQLVLAAEVVIEVAGRQIGGGGDVAHAGGREAAFAEDAGGGAEDVQPAQIRPAANPGAAADRTAVR
jgi:hypothetical protein